MLTRFPCGECGFDSPTFRFFALVVKRKSSLASNEVFRVRILAGVLSVDGVCGVKACIRGCEPRGAGFDSRQTHWLSGACSWESKLPPKQPHRVRILALLLVPVWLDTERRRTRNAV